MRPCPRAIPSWLWTSTADPRATRRKPANSARFARPCPSAIFELTDTEALRSCSPRAEPPRNDGARVNDSISVASWQATCHAMSFSKFDILHRRHGYAPLRHHFRAGGLIRSLPSVSRLSSLVSRLSSLVSRLSSRSYWAGPSSCWIVAVLGARVCCSRAATCSAWRSTRITLSPASFLRSSSLQPRRISSAKIFG